MKYVDVILPLALANLFTYIVPEELINEVEVGKRVLVQFGKKKVQISLEKDNTLYIRTGGGFS